MHGGFADVLHNEGRIDRDQNMTESGLEQDQNETGTGPEDMRRSSGCVDMAGMECMVGSLMHLMTMGRQGPEHDRNATGQTRNRTRKGLKEDRKGRAPDRRMHT